MGRPSISLLVPCYNAEAYVRGFLECAKAQTWPYHEIICYDDASTDRTPELIEAEGIPVIRANRNRGPAHARQKLLEAATGDFVHFHDVDDLVSNRLVETVSPLLDAETAVICKRKEIDQNGAEKIVTLANADFSNGRVLVTRHFIHFNQAVFPAAFTREHMQLASDLRILEDRLAFLSMAAGGVKFQYVDEVLTTFVKRSGSLTASQSRADGMDCIYTYWKRAAPLVGDHMQALADYVSYTAWCFYYEEAAVYPQLKRIIRSIQKRGLSPLQNASRAERQLARFFAPETIYWLRRSRAGWRSKRPST